MTTFEDATFGWMGRVLGLSGQTTAHPESIDAFVTQHALIRVPEATAVFLYGSVAVETSSAFSDIDVLCLIEGHDRLEKHQFTADGRLFELTVLSNSLLPKLRQLTLRFGTPVGLYALSLGRLIAGDVTDLENVQQSAAATLADLRRLGPGREDALRRDVLRDMMAMVKTSEDDKRMLHAISIQHRIARHTLQDDLNQKFVSRSAINGLAHMSQSELLRTLCVAAARHDWDSFSKAVQEKLYGAPMTWDHISRLI